VQAHLTALADGDTPPIAFSEPPDLAAFVADLSSAWRIGEVRPTFSVEAKPCYLRSLQSVVQRDLALSPIAGINPVVPQTPSSAPVEKVLARTQLIFCPAW
jgi:hypothetical protein